MSVSWHPDMAESPPSPSLSELSGVAVVGNRGLGRSMPVAAAAAAAAGPLAAAIAAAAATVDIHIIEESSNDGIGAAVAPGGIGEPEEEDFPDDARAAMDCARASAAAVGSRLRTGSRFQAFPVSASAVEPEVEEVEEIVRPSAFLLWCVSSTDCLPQCVFYFVFELIHCHQ